ncbi:MAG TPA: hypothetical protein VGK50_07715 [Coriobacteriia bacterium]
MSRRLLALACALALLAPAAPASAFDRLPYVHTWQAEGMVGGDLGGEARKSVERDEMRMTLDRGRFQGDLRYADGLAVKAASGVVTGQSASIEITLTGSPAEGGAAAAGSFSGVATLVTRELASLDDMGGMAARSDGIRVVYEVSGHWGARLSGGVAAGELLFERATPVSQSAADADVHEATWFDRLSAEKGGGAQSFRVEVRGLAAGPVPRPAPGATSSDRPAAAADAQPALGFLDFVARGIAGAPGVPAAPVPLALSTSARALEDAAPPGATRLPADAVAIDVDVPGAYLDAKNRAAGLLDEGGPAGAAGGALRKAWNAGEIPASVNYSPPGYDVLRQLKALLAEQKAIRGAAELTSDVAGAVGGADTRLLQAWLNVARALGDEKPHSVLAATAGELQAVAEAPLPRSGPLADAVLVAMRSRLAPPGAADVRAMQRDASQDASGSAAGDRFPDRVLARAGGSTSAGAGTLSFDTSTGRTTLAPGAWPAYRRGDGTPFWLAGPDGTVALTDGTLRGAGFTVPRAFLVDAADAGRVVAVYDLR